VICGSPDYFRKFGRPQAPQDLQAHNCLATCIRARKAGRFEILRPLLVEVKGSLSSNSNAVLIQMALNGAGIIRVPLHAVKAEIADKKLDVIFKTFRFRRNECAPTTQR
jgi:DNA-binding transcriptional LysR family regulator